MAEFRTNTGSKYELKHRLIGAAIMILSAVLIIPFFLTEPNIQANVDEEVRLILEEDNTFKSKVAPITLKALKAAKLSEKEKESSNEKPALVKIDKTKKIDKEPIKKEVVEEKSEKKKEKTKGKIILTSVENASPKAEKKEQSKEPVDVVKEEVVKDGWTVRVGTFSKNENVESITNLLNANGFDTNLTPVTTTLGKATRVWLGPYSTKDIAKKTSVRLKSLTGEKGYVTKQAS